MAELTIPGIESAVLLLMEIDDFSSPEASELSELLVQLATTYREQGVDRAADALLCCKEQITPESNYGHTVQQISKTMSCLQEMELNGVAIEEIAFPGEGIDVNQLIDSLNEEPKQEAPVSEQASNELLGEKINSAVMALMEVDDFGSAESIELENLLEEMANIYQQQGKERPSTALKFCLARMVPGADYGYVVQQISKTLNCLQNVVLQGKSLDDVTFPNEEHSEDPPVAQAKPAVVAQVTDQEKADSFAEAMAEEEKPEQKSVMFTGDPELLDLFIQDATDHLGSVESDLLVLEENPSDSDALDAAFRSFHSVKGSAGFAQLVPIEKIAHAMEELLDLARDGKLSLQGKTMDLILATLDAIRVWVHRVEISLETSTPMEFTSEGEEFIVLIGTVVNGTADLSNMKIPEKLKETTASDSEADSEDDFDSESSELVTENKQAQTSGKKGKRTEAVRVDRDRLDELIDLIGELVISESMVSADLQELQEGAIESKAHTQLRKITRELQGLSLSLRMMPINGLFQKGKRVIRDLSHKLGKPVDLVIEGGETELDKSILDELSDPLVHLIRNSVDHGVECSVKDRSSGGKNETATITLRAFYQGGNIYVEIEDDGRGLDREKLLARAIERGVIEPNANLTDDQIHNLIFEAGFSMAAKVTEVSGRGVGMDVVRRNIEALRGSVTIRSEQGKGTCISLRLPLTLAIIDGMVVRVQDQRYIIPTLSIVNQLRPEPEALSTVNDRGEIVDVRGQNVPFHRLANIFSLPGEKREVTDSIIILVEDNNRLVGLLVDEVVGQQQVVIKSLGASLSDSSDGIAGAAVMPDGEVGLILDLHGVLELACGTHAKQ